VEFSQALLLDTAAYTLNRLPPRYIVSERGITRLMADHMFEESENGNIQSLVELLLLVNSAVDVVKRRQTAAGNGDEAAEDAEADDHLEPHWHNIPFLIGRVVDCKSGEPVPDIRITLLVNGDKLEQAGSGWTNPCTTNAATRGFYSFLPKAIHSEEPKKKFALRIMFESDAYESQTVEQSAVTEGELSARHDFRNDGFINLGTTCLKRK
jgi:competence protein ComFB